MSDLNERANPPSLSRLEPIFPERADRVAAGTGFSGGGVFGTILKWLFRIFLLLAVSLGVLLATVPIKTYVLIWAVTTIVLIAAGVGASVLWLRSVLRRLDIGFRFAPVPAG